MFRIEIQRQVMEVVQFFVDDPIQKSACNAAYESVLDEGGEVVSRDYGNYAPHIIKIEEIK